LRPGAAEAGDIVHVDGRVLGRHSGIINYTIGQRKGIGVAAQEPLYVLRLDASAREVVVGPREALRTRVIKLRDVNWLGDEPLEAFAAAGEEILARIRSSGPLQPARLSLEEDGFTVEFARGEDGVSPGQACVFMPRVAAGAASGGGWIKSATGGTGWRRRLCGIRGKKRNRKGVGGRIAVSPPIKAALRGRRGNVAHKAPVMDAASVRHAYRRWAPVYDFTFGMVAEAGRKHAVRIINRRKGRC
jgi:hypothetical protein